MKSIFVSLIFLFSLLISIPQFANAQNVAASSTKNAGTITGIVIDSATKKPIDFMTIALKKANVVIKTMVTKTSGDFSFDQVAPGTYTISAIAIGYHVKNTAAEITIEKNAANLGNIIVTPQVNTLKEVAVTADRPIIKQEVDRISYDIQADPESKNLTVLDMMRKVPLLSLDAEDNIKLKGSGNYKILINGKPSNMVARSPKDVLRSMPASTIQKIEVITTPPSKYDSEGLDGIINIITNKKIDNGYNASVNLREQGPVGGPGLGAYLTLKQNKFGMTAYGGTGYYSSPSTASSNNRTTSGINATTLFSNGAREFDNNYRYGGAELSYEIDTLNLITAELNPNSGYNESTSTQLSRMFDSSQQVNYDMVSNNRYEWGGLDATLNYQLGFKSNKERLLTFSYRYSNSSNPQDNALVFSNRVNYNETNYIQTNDSRSKEQTIQLDYVHPVKKLNIEGGLKGILRDNNSNFEYKNFDDATGSFILDPSRTNKYDNNQDIVGAYNSYSINLKDWGFKAGVRVEGTFVKADFISSGSNVNTDYFNVIPTFSVNRKFKNMSSLNFGYTQRIERPGIGNLNPFVDRSVPNFESTGNPNLKAVLSNNFEMRYSKFKKGSVNVGLSYNFANNTVQNVSIYNAADKITYSTYLNIGKDRTLNTNLNINYPLTSKWNISMSGNIGYKQIEGTINGVMIKNDGLTGYGYANTGYKFEHGWRANGSFSYSAPYVMLQGKTSSYIYMAFSGSKDLVKDKLTLSASINNPFTKYRVYRSFTEGPNFSQTYTSENYSRSFNTSLNWRFGKLKDSIKKNKRSISNDDVKSGGSKEGS
jgi:hypothetical protein